MASLGSEIQRHIGEELRTAYATPTTDEFPDRLGRLLRQLQDKFEPSTEDGEKNGAEADHASE
jgi:hypothetical protein